MIHRCHAEGCDVPVSPRMLMCFAHWKMVPDAIKQAVWRQYRPGQEISKDPSAQYMEAKRAAIESVAQQEGRR